MLRVCQAKHQPAAGFTLVEILTAVVLLTLAFLGLAAGFLANARAYASTRDEILVSHGFRQVVETIRSAPFGDIAATYQGLTFDVPEIGGTGTVRTFVDETEISDDAATLGLPRDLDGDGVALTPDVTGSYVLLPLRIRIAWTSSDGYREKDLYLLLAREKD